MSKSSPCYRRELIQGIRNALGNTGILQGKRCKITEERKCQSGKPCYFFLVLACLAAGAGCSCVGGI